MKFNLDRSILNFEGRYFQEGFIEDRDYPVYFFNLKANHMVKYFSQFFDKNSNSEDIIKFIKNHDVIDAVKNIYGEDFIKNKERYVKADVSEYKEVINWLSYWSYIGDHDEYIYYMNNYILFVEVEEGLTGINIDKEIFRYLKMKDIINKGEVK